MEIASASGKVQLLAQSSGEHDNADSNATSTQPPRVQLTVGPKNKVFFIFYKRNRVGNEEYNNDTTSLHYES